MSFSIREGALRVGDLALLWGRPEILSPTDRDVRLNWPHQEVIALSSLGQSGQLSYFQPVRSVLFMSPISQ